MFVILSSGSNNPNITYLANASSPFSVMFPGSQNAFFNFFFTAEGESNMSILLSSSEEDILPPVNPGTK